MKKMVLALALMLVPMGLVFATSQTAKLDKNGRNSDLQVGITSSETRMIKCGEDGAQLFRNASYETKTSTCQASKTSSTASVYIASTTMIVDGYEMYALGDEVALTGAWIAGTAYIPAGQRSEKRFEVPVSSFSFTATLGAATTFYYRIDGHK